MELLFCVDWRCFCRLVLLKCSSLECKCFLITTASVTLTAMEALDRGHEGQLAQELDIHQATHDADSGDIFVAGMSTEKIYRNQALNHELLSAEEEASLAKQVQAGIAASFMLKQLTSGDVTSLHTPGKRETVEAIINMGNSAKNSLFHSNLKLVYSRVKESKYSEKTRNKYKDIPIVEMIQDGNIGLQRAIERFDPGKGYKFSTYAVAVIKDHISKGADRSSSTKNLLHIPSERRKDFAKVRDALESGISSTDISAISKATELSEAQVREVILNYNRATVTSLDKPVGEDGNSTLGEKITDQKQLSPEQEVLGRVMQKEVLRTIDHALEFHPRLREVVVLTFGIGEEHPLTESEIADQLGISYERVRQLKRQALSRLREPLKQYRTAS